MKGITVELKDGRKAIIETYWIDHSNQLIFRAVTSNPEFITLEKEDFKTMSVDKNFAIEVLEIWNKIRKEKELPALSLQKAFNIYE